MADLKSSGRPLPFDPATVADLFFVGLPAQLLWTVTRSAVLELNIARLEGRLSGETPEERFDAFVDLLRDPDIALAILERYPVLARQLVTRIGNWCDGVIELLRQLTDDWPTIRETFGVGEPPGPLADVRMGAGDRHRGGRTVCLLTFASGWRLVYKPRPMAIAVHFQELLRWLNDRGFTPALRPMAICDRGAYGWLEFVDAHACEAPPQIGLFYQRMGGLLALLYTLDATDFHYENVIAAGGHPVLIDLESVVQPRPPTTHRTDLDWLATETMAQSVLRVGLLPQRASGGAGDVDITGLGMQPGQLTPDAHPYWEDRGTDAMRLDRRQFTFPDGMHRPTLGDAGDTADVAEYVEDIVAGFRRAYETIARHRAELLAATGPIARMQQDEVRIILRPTRTYALLLQESYHPHLLGDALIRDRHFDHLWVGATESPAVSPIIAAERRELLNGDIPLFTTRIDSHDLFGVDGERWPAYFTRTGLDVVRERLASLDAGDLEKQIWFVRGSLAAHQINLVGADTALEELFPISAVPAASSRQRLLDAATAVGDRLEVLALQSQDEATWIGLQSRGGRDYRLMPLGGDLYSGLPGVAVFLAYLADITGEARYARLARAGWQTLWNRRGSWPELITSVGGFDGWGGLLWTLTHLSRLWQEPAYLTEARTIAGRLRDLIPRDEGLDVISGSAGCLVSLLTLHQVTREDAALAAAVVCGERLLATQRPMPQGAAWLPVGMGALALQPMAGFAHGTSGYAWALLELSAATGDDRFRAAALNALEYERTLFLPEIGSWKETRRLEGRIVSMRSADDDLYMLAWCHGAPGAGLARIRALKHVDDPRLDADVQICLQTTIDRGFNRSHCLCHGDLGNVELLLEAARTQTPDTGGRWRAEADVVGARVLQSITEHGRQSGLPRGVEVPGLMTGLAGIGYGLLRLADPDRIPSVLLLDPPHAS